MLCYYVIYKKFFINYIHLKCFYYFTNKVYIRVISHYEGINWKTAYLSFGLLFACNTMAHNNYLLRSEYFGYTSLKRLSKDSLRRKSLSKGLLLCPCKRSKYTLCFWNLQNINGFCGGSYCSWYCIIFTLILTCPFK